MRGARHLAPRIDVDAAVIAEPTDLDVIRGHKGVVRFHVAVQGKAAHSSKPYLGVNAISGMARLVTRLEEVIGADYASREDPLLGNPTMNIGVIEGGMQVNFVPDRCRIDVDVRMVPGQTADGVTAQFAEVIAEEEGIDAVLEDPYMTLAAVGTAEEEEIVRSAVAACREVLGEAVIGGRALRHGRQSLRRPRGADDHPRAGQHRPGPRRRGVGRVPAGDPSGGRVPADHAEPGLTLSRRRLGSGTWRNAAPDAAPARGRSIPSGSPPARTDRQATALRGPSIPRCARSAGTGERAGGAGHRRRTPSRARLRWPRRR